MEAALIHILIVLIVFALIFWIISIIPLPEPFGMVARVVVAAIFVLWLLLTLLHMAPASEFPECATTKSASTVRSLIANVCAFPHGTGTDTNSLPSFLWTVPEQSVAK